MSQLLQGRQFSRNGPVNLLKQVPIVATPSRPTVLWNGPIQLVEKSPIVAINADSSRGMVPFNWLEKDQLFNFSVAGMSRGMVPFSRLPWRINFCKSFKADSPCGMAPSIGYERSEL